MGAARARSHEIARWVGTLAAVVAVAYGWVGVRAADGSPLVAGAAVVATMGLAATLVGPRLRVPWITPIGMILVGVAAPTGFGYIANVVAVACGIALAATRTRQPTAGAPTAGAPRAGAPRARARRGR